VGDPWRHEAALTSEPYKTIAADPPWKELGGCGRGTGNHYETIRDKADILRVMVTAPCWRPAVVSHLWLWTTTTSLRDGIWLMEALGYDYKTFAIWAKLSQQGELIAGMGQYTRHTFEPILFGVRGNGARKLTPAGHGYVDLVETVEKAVRQGHSEKPAEMYQLIERVSLGTPRLEMFARKPRKGWDIFGIDGYQREAGNATDVATVGGA
jgi:N6-adenosine-specific RNA methylase IME4